MTRARPYSILVVEDEPSVADLLVTLLRDEGYKVALARDGTAAIGLLDQRHAARERVDLVLLDMMLPGVAGGQVLRHGLTLLDGAPIVALSADPDTLVQAARWGRPQPLPSRSISPSC